MIDELGDFLRWGIAIDIDAVSDGGEAGADIGFTHEPIRIEVAFDIDGYAFELDLILLSIGPHDDGEATTQRCEQQLDGVGAGIGSAEGLRLVDSNGVCAANGIALCAFTCPLYLTLED